MTCLQSGAWLGRERCDGLLPLGWLQLGFGISKHRQLKPRVKRLHNRGTHQPSCAATCTHACLDTSYM